MQASVQAAFLRRARTPALVVLSRPTMLSRRARLRAVVRLRTRLSSSRKRSTACSVSAVRMVSGEYRDCPPRPVHGSTAHAATASSANQILRLPRWRRLASWSPDAAPAGCDGGGSGSA